MASQSLRICIQMYNVRESLPFFVSILPEKYVVGFSVRNTFVYKFANFARLYFPQFTTFRHQPWQF